MAFRKPGSSRSRLPLVLLTAFILALVYFFRTRTSYALSGLQSSLKLGKDKRPGTAPAVDVDRGKHTAAQNRTLAQLQWDPKSYCTRFPTSHRVVVSAQTAANKASSQLPILMETSLRCAIKTVLFSDKAETIGKWELRDSLKSVSASVRESNPDFDHYKQQQHIENHAQPVKELRALQPADEGSGAVWTLDKYRFLHIIEQSWDTQPNADWYLHVDADTYVVWSSLLEWIERLDPLKEIILSAAPATDGKDFLHGGLLVSRAAMYNFAVTHKGSAAQWDQRIRENCCGKDVFGQILAEHSVDTKQAWPTLQGEAPARIPFSETRWCQPVVTMQHVSFKESRDFWHFERKRQQPKEPIIYSEIFREFISEKIPSSGLPYEDWFNFSDDLKFETHSAKDCVKACESNPDCFQSMFVSDGQCTLGTKHFRLGVGKAPDEDGKSYYSHWNRARIDRWIGQQKPCGRVVFPFQEHE